MIALPATYLFSPRRASPITACHRGSEDRSACWAGRCTEPEYGFFGAPTLTWGENWSPDLEIREQHTLVTEGVYRHIRHPMYAAHWLWGLGQALLLQNWIAGPSTLVALLPMYLVRVPRRSR